MMEQIEVKQDLKRKSSEKKSVKQRKMTKAQFTLPANAKHIIGTRSRSNCGTRKFAMHEAFAGNMNQA